MSRVFLHESIHDEVISIIKKLIPERHTPGVPVDMKTTMGPLVSARQRDRVLEFIETAKAEGAQLALGGGPPKDKPELEGGFFVEPTVFVEVQPSMRIAREEIFGPVMSIFKWADESQVYDWVNNSDYGLTASIFTNNLVRAQKASRKVEAGLCLDQHGVYRVPAASTCSQWHRLTKHSSGISALLGRALRWSEIQRSREGREPGRAARVYTAEECKYGALRERLTADGKLVEFKRKKTGTRKHYAIYMPETLILITFGGLTVSPMKLCSIEVLFM
jgi:hypothetical protein